MHTSIDVKIVLADVHTNSDLQTLRGDVSVPVCVKSCDVMSRHVTNVFMHITFKMTMTMISRSVNSLYTKR